MMVMIMIIILMIMTVIIIMTINMFITSPLIAMIYFSLPKSLFNASMLYPGKTKFLVPFTKTTSCLERNSPFDL